MSLSWTKIMTNVDYDRNKKVGNTVIERVDKNVYLGNKLTLGLDNQTDEVKRRFGQSK